MNWKIALPYVPISQNSDEWRGRWSRAKYKSAIENDVWTICKAQKFPPLKQARLYATVFFPDKRIRDLDNYYAPLYKGLLDGLQDASVIPGDDTRYIPELPGLRFGYDKENPRTEITIHDIMPSAGEEPS